MALVSRLPPQSVRRTAWRSGDTPHYYRDIVYQAGRNKSEFDRIEIQTQVKRTCVCERPCVCGDDRQVTDTFNALSIRIEVAMPEPSLGRGRGYTRPATRGTVMQSKRRQTQRTKATRTRSCDVSGAGTCVEQSLPGAARGA